MSCSALTMKGSLLVTLLAPFTVWAQTCPSEGTPSQQAGPFFVPGAPFTRRLARADQLTDPNNVLIVNGTVHGDDCVPMSNALVDIWYAGPPDENGDLYSVAGSSLLYRAQILTDECGNYEYTSTFPISYPDRPIQHIHYRVSDNRELLTTQLYFEGYIPDQYTPHPSLIAPVQTDGDGRRRVSFDLYVNGAGTANETVCRGATTAGTEGPSGTRPDLPPSTSQSTIPDAPSTNSNPTPATTPQSAPSSSGTKSFGALIIIALLLL